MIRNSLRGESYRTASAQHNYFEAAARKLREIPGVEAVSAVSFPPPLALFAPTPFVLSGQAARSRSRSDRLHPECAARVFRNPAHPDRERTLDYRCGYRRFRSSGRGLPVGCKAVFSKGDPVGQSFRLTGSDQRDWRIVGVVGRRPCPGTQHAGSRRLYFPHSQMPAPTMTFVIRTRTAPMAVANTAQQSLWSLGK